MKYVMIALCSVLGLIMGSVFFQIINTPMRGTTPQAVECLNDVTKSSFNASSDRGFYRTDMRIESRDGLIVYYTQAGDGCVIADLGPVGEDARK